MLIFFNSLLRFFFILIKKINLTLIRIVLFYQYQLSDINKKKLIENS